MLRVTVFWILCLACVAPQALADDRIAEGHSDVTIMITEGTPEDIRTVIVAGGARTVGALLPIWFDQFGPELPDVVAFDVLTIAKELTKKDTALVVSSAETALPVLDPLFDEPNLRFFALKNKLFLENASAILSDGSSFGTGEPFQHDGSAGVVVMANGHADGSFETLLYPGAVPLAQVNELVSQLALEIGKLQPLTQENLISNVTANYGVLIDANALRQNAVATLAKVIQDPHLYKVKQSTAFVDVTPPLRPGAQRNLEARAQSKSLDDSEIELSSVAIEVLESGLNKYGVFDETPDGIYGPSTQRALNLWAEQNGFTQTETPTFGLISELFDVRKVVPRKPGEDQLQQTPQPVEFVVLHGVNLGINTTKSHFYDPLFGALNFNGCMAACAAEPLCKAVSYNHGCEIGTGIAYRNDWGTTGFAADGPSMSSLQDVYSAVILRSLTSDNQDEIQRLVATRDDYRGTDAPLPNFPPLESLGLRDGNATVDLSGFQRRKKPQAFQRWFPNYHPSEWSRASGAPEAYSEYDWLVVSPMHLQALQSWAETTETRQKNAVAVAAMFEEALQDAEDRFGKNDPRLMPILVDFSRFWESSGDELERDWDAKREQSLSFLKRAAQLISDVSATGRRADRILWNRIAAATLVSSITPDSWEITDPAQMEDGLQFGLCFATPEANLSRSNQLIRIAAEQRALEGTTSFQVGWLKAASVCLDDPDRMNAILRVRAGLTVDTDAPETMTIALADLALREFNRSKPEAATDLMRQAATYHRALDGDTKPAFWDTASYNSEYLNNVSWIDGLVSLPFDMLRPLGLQDEIDYIAVVEALSLIEDRRRSQNGDQAELRVLSNVLPGISDPKLATAILRGLYRKFDLGTEPSALSALLHIFEQNKGFAEDGGLALLEFGITLTDDASPDTQLALYRRLASEHAINENLQQASMYAETALEIVATQSAPLNPTETKALRGMVAESGRQQGNVELRAQQLAQALADDLEPVCQRRRDMGSFPWLRLELFQDDQLLADAFVAQPVIDDYLACFEKFEFSLAEKTDVHGYVPAIRLADAMYLLAMRNERDSALALLGRVLTPSTWRSSTQPENTRYSALSAAIDGIILGGKAHWVHDQTGFPKLPAEPRLGSDGVAALTRLGYSYDALGLRSEAAAIYEILSNSNDCKAAPANCEFLAAYEAKFQAREPSPVIVKELLTSTLYFPPPGLRSAPDFDPALRRRNGELRMKQHLDANRLYAAELYAQALYAFEGSLENLVQNPEMLQAGSRTNLIRVIAQSRLASGKVGEARKLTTQVVEELQSRNDSFAVFGDDPLVRRAARSRPILEAHLDAATLPYGFDLSDIPENARSDFFAMQLAQTTNTAATFAKLSARMPAPERESLRALQDVSARIADAADAAAIGGDAVALAELRAERDRLLESLGPSAVNRIRLAFPTIEEVGGLLRTGEAFLLTYVGETSSYFWLVTKERSELRRIPLGQSEMAKLTENVRNVVEAKADDEPVNLGVLYQTHQALLGDFGTALNEVGTLIIVPNGPLDSLPWNVLLTRKPQSDFLGSDELRDAQLPWMIRRYSMAQVPSLAAAHFLRTNPYLANDNNRAFFGVGRPDFGNGIQITPPNSVRAGSGYAARPLPETGPEIDRMSALFGADPIRDIRMDERATEAQLRDVDLTSYSVLAFATHGVLSDEIPGLNEPALLLSAPTEPASPMNDGILRASEIADLRLNAELVILSACNTAGSSGASGAEGLSGLANAFIYAGSRSLIVTHWQIPSNAAAEITLGATILRRSEQANTWSDALRRSALNMIDRSGNAKRAHPVNWGAFVFVGMPS